MSNNIDETRIVPAETPSIDAYQVTFTVEDIGRRFKKSKKRITWVFSFGGVQHTVIMVWSKRSGKQSVEMDGKEEWFGRAKGYSIFNHKWVSNDGIKLHIIASKMTPNKTPDFRKYELMINGQRFSSLPFQDGSTPETEVLNSIVSIVYPDGYEWDDPRFLPDPHDPTSTVDEYKKNENLRNKVYARRIVRHDGTPR